MGADLSRYLLVGALMALTYGGVPGRECSFAGYRLPLERYWVRARVDGAFPPSF